MEHSTFLILLIILVVIATVWIFVNTIITKKWRNKVSGESEGWKLGVFYYNPDDKRMFLPKRTGLGMTINFARPWSIILTILLILTMIYMMKGLS